MAKLMETGHLGDKTPQKGGFYRRVRDGKKTEVFVLDTAKGEYHPAHDALVDLPDFVVAMKRLHRVGRYREALAVMLEASGWQADLLRRVVLGYVSYGLNRVGEVIKEARDVDRIMGFGFNWAPPSVLVDFMGVKPTIAALERAKLVVPEVLVSHRSGRMFNEPNVDVGRFFVG
jgi:hypothetical protein